MATIQLLADFDTDGYIAEPFGVKGVAELTLRHCMSEGMTEALFGYSQAAAQSLRNAARKLTEATGATFTFEKLGKEYREVTYPVTRTLKDGSAKTITITRKYLNAEVIRVGFVQAEADAAIAAEAEATEQ